METTGDGVDGWLTTVARTSAGSDSRREREAAGEAHPDDADPSTLAAVGKLSSELSAETW